MATLKPLRLYAAARGCVDYAHAQCLAQRRASHRGASTSNAEELHPVVISGAGPSGLTLALQLADYGEINAGSAPRPLRSIKRPAALLASGVRSVVLERRTQLMQHPQAHFINNRTMEVGHAPCVGDVRL